MKDRLDPSSEPGRCPLCLGPVPLPPEPRTSADVLAVLERHFGKACRALVVMPPWPNQA